MGFISSMADFKIGFLAEKSRIHQDFQSYVKKGIKMLMGILSVSGVPTERCSRMWFHRWYQRRSLYPLEVFVKTDGFHS